jgi:hypothetical protein
VIIDGRPLVRGGRMQGVDEAAIVRRGAAATRRLWQEAKRQGFFPAEAEPARA